VAPLFILAALTGVISAGIAHGAARGGRGTKAPGPVRASLLQELHSDDRIAGLVSRRLLLLNFDLYPVEVFLDVDSLVQVSA
jgi:hypothetical protein